MVTRFSSAWCGGRVADAAMTGRIDIRVKIQLTGLNPNANLRYATPPELVPAT